MSALLFGHTDWWGKAEKWNLKNDEDAIKSHWRRLGRLRDGSAWG